uniref:Uncharacterized protein n=1 Tax=viral metagenome TaxID=1070528 RepID=A0A6M3MCF3_9ZZZZ
MKSIKDRLTDDGVFFPEHGIDYDMDCEKCHEVTRDYVVKNGYKRGARVLITA